MNRIFVQLFLIVIFAAGGASLASAQSPGSANGQSERLVQLERKLADVERQAKSGSRDAANGSAVAFLFGAFCALWAQNTKRGAWLWFFLGLFFNVITVIVLLVKNSGDRFDRRQQERYAQG